MSRKVVQIFLKAAISIFLLIYLFKTKVSLPELVDSIHAVNYLMLSVALATFVVSCVAGALQWNSILRMAGVTTPASEIVRLYFIGLFFNNFLPANIGGDAVKIFDLGKTTGKPVKVFCGTLLDRVIGLLALNIFALVAVFLSIIFEIDLPKYELLVVSFFAWSVILSILLSQRAGLIAIKFLQQIKLLAISQRLEQFRSEFKLYREQVSGLLVVLLIALGVQLLRILTHLFFAAGIGLVFSGTQLLQLFVLIPMLGILIALPISIGGLGVREMAAGTLFVSLGVVATASDAVAMELGTWIIQVIVSLIGGFFFLTGKRKLKEQ